MYRELICSACDFYKPEDQLECGAYKVLVYFMEMGRLSPEEVELAVSQACGKSIAQEIRR